MDSNWALDCSIQHPPNITDKSLCIPSLMN